MAALYVLLVAQLLVYEERVESFHDAVQSAPAGVGSSGGVSAAASEGARSAAEGSAVDANAVAARKGRSVSSFILGALLCAVVNEEVTCTIGTFQT